MLKVALLAAAAFFAMAAGALSYRALFDLAARRAEGEWAAAVRYATGADDAALAGEGSDGL